MTDFDDGIRESLLNHLTAATDSKSLGVDQHGVLHQQVAGLAVAIQDVLLATTDWTPVVHTENLPDFVRGTGGGGNRGQSWGKTLRVGNWAWASGTIRTGTSGFVEGTGIYNIVLPYKAFIPPTQAPIIGHATVAAGPSLNHFDLNVHAGKSSNLSDGTVAFFTYDNGVAFWSTTTDDSWPSTYPSSQPNQVQRIPSLTNTTGDIHLHLGPYYIDRS